MAPFWRKASPAEPGEPQPPEGRPLGAAGAGDLATSPAPAGHALPLKPPLLGSVAMPPGFAALPGSFKDDETDAWADEAVASEEAAPAVDDSEDVSSEALAAAAALAAARARADAEGDETAFGADSDCDVDAAFASPSSTQLDVNGWERFSSSSESDDDASVPARELRAASRVAGMRARLDDTCGGCVVKFVSSDLAWFSYWLCAQLPAQVAAAVWRSESELVALGTRGVSAWDEPVALRNRLRRRFGWWRLLPLLGCRVEWDLPPARADAEERSAAQPRATLFGAVPPLADAPGEAACAAYGGGPNGGGGGARGGALGGALPLASPRFARAPSQRSESRSGVESAWQPLRGVDASSSAASDDAAGGDGGSEANGGGGGGGGGGGSSARLLPRHATRSDAVEVAATPRASRGRGEAACARAWRGCLCLSGWLVPGCLLPDGAQPVPRRLVLVWANWATLKFAVPAGLAAGAMCGAAEGSALRVHVFRVARGWSASLFLLELLAFAAWGQNADASRWARAVQPHADDSAGEAQRELWAAAFAAMGRLVVVGFGALACGLCALVLFGRFGEWAGLSLACPLLLVVCLNLGCLSPWSPVPSLRVLLYGERLAAGVPSLSDGLKACALPAAVRGQLPPPHYVSVLRLFSIVYDGAAWSALALTPANPLTPLVDARVVSALQALSFFSLPSLRYAHVFAALALCLQSIAAVALACDAAGHRLTSIFVAELATDTLALGITRNLFKALDCSTALDAAGHARHAPDGSVVQHLDADAYADGGAGAAAAAAEPPVVCWHGEHLSMVAVALLLLVPYFAASGALKLLFQRRQSMVVYAPLYWLAYSHARAAAIGAALFFSLHRKLTLSALFGINLVFLGWNVLSRPCNVALFNHMRSLAHCMSLWCLGCGLAVDAYAHRPERALLLYHTFRAGSGVLLCAGLAALAVWASRNPSGEAAGRAVVERWRLDLSRENARARTRAALAHAIASAKAERAAQRAALTQSARSADADDGGADAARAAAVAPGVGVGGGGGGVAVGADGAALAGARPPVRGSVSFALFTSLAATAKKAVGDRLARSDPGARAGQPHAVASAAASSSGQRVEPGSTLVCRESAFFYVLGLHEALQQGAAALKAERAAERAARRAARCAAAKRDGSLEAGGDGDGGGGGGAAGGAPAAPVVPAATPPPPPPAAPAQAVVVPPGTVRFALSGGRVLREEVCALVGALPVGSVDLSGCFVGIFEWTTLCRGWERNKALRALTLRRTNLDGDAAREVRQLLAHQPRLQRLDLANNRLADAGARELAAGLRANRRLLGSALQVLDVRQNGLGAEGGRALLEAAVESGAGLAPPLRELCGLPVRKLAADALGGPRLALGGQRLGVAEAAMLCRLLPLAPSVVSLRLSANLLESEAAYLLGVELGRLGCALTDLDLADNPRIGDAGARALARGLRENRSLVSLDLRGAGIGGKGRLALGEAVLGNAHSALERVATDGLALALGATSACVQRRGLQGCDGALLFAPVRAHRSLVALDASYNDLGDDGALAAALALARAPRLRALNLAANGVGLRGACALACALAGLDPADGAGLTHLLARLERDAFGGGGGGGGARAADDDDDDGDGGDGDADADDASPLSALARSRTRSGAAGARLAAARQLSRAASLSVFPLSVFPLDKRRAASEAAARRDASASVSAQAVRGLVRSNSTPDVTAEPAGGSGAGQPPLSPPLLRLEALRLDGNALPPRAVSLLCAALAQRGGCALRELGLSGAAVDAEAGRCLGILLRACGSLRSLDLSYCAGLGDECASELADGLMLNTSLTQLDMQGNECSEIGRWTLARALESNTSSAVVFLADNRWALRASSVLLPLSDCQLTDADASLLCAALRFNRVSEELRLCQNRFSHLALEAVGRMLHANAGLRSVDISCNPGRSECHEDAVLPLCHALAYNDRLERLRYAHGGLSPSAGVQLGHALAFSRSLLDLDVSYNALGDAGCSTIASALRVNSSLRTLSLAANGISAIGASALCDLLAACQDTAPTHGAGGEAAPASPHIGAPRSGACSPLLALRLGVRSETDCGADGGDGGAGGVAGSSLTELDLAANDLDPSTRASLIAAWAQSPRREPEALRL